MDIKRIIQEEVNDFKWVSDKLSQDDIEFVASNLKDRTELKLVDGFHFKKVFIDGLSMDDGPYSFYPQFLLTPPSLHASIYQDLLMRLKKVYSFSDSDFFEIFKRYRELILPYIESNIKK
jgi:hypothetical protein